MLISRLPKFSLIFIMLLHSSPSYKTLKLRSFSSSRRENASCIEIRCWAQLPSGLHPGVSFPQIPTSSQNLAPPKSSRSDSRALTQQPGNWPEMSWILTISFLSPRIQREEGDPSLEKNLLNLEDIEAKFRYLAPS